MRKFWLSLLTSFFLGLTFAAPVWAADRALANIIGYSQDLKYFAFEEYGIQDGSGFAFSSYYIIDLEKDRWVVGTPVRAIAEDENESLEEIRLRAAQEIAPRFKNLAVNVPADVLAYIGDGAPEHDGRKILFGFPSHAGPDDISGRYTLQLGETQVAAASPCIEWFGEAAIGFSLSVEDHDSEREIHNDRNLPRSRGCPIEYRITGVFAPHYTADIAHTVALISIYAHGFEGSDRRFIIVPLALRQQTF